jgi:hypothetical protein
MSRSLIVLEPWRSQSRGERLHNISDCFVFTTPIKHVLRQLRERVEDLPSSKSKRAIVLTGPDGTGKTALAQHFAESYPPSDGEGADCRTVVLTSPPGKIDATSLADTVISACKWPVRLRYRNLSPEGQMDYVLDQCQTRMLIFTRADFLAPNDEKKIAPDTITFFVRLLDRAVPTIVLVASPLFARRLNSISELRGKLTALPIRPVRYGRSWLKVVEQYDAILPFEKGGLMATGMPEMLHLGTGGKLPLLSGLTADTGRLALRGPKRSDRLLKEHFERAFPLYLPGEPNPFAGDRDLKSLLAEIARKSSLEDLTPDSGDN